MQMRPRGLWGHADFTRLWAGETLSLVGSQVGVLALPLTAVLVLDATPAQVGVLQAASYAPFLLVALVAGWWVDGRPKRPILIWSYFGRALLLGLVPLSAAFDALSLTLLYVVAFGSGALNVFFHLAYQAFLPVLVPTPKLVEGNSKLQASASAAEMGGPSLGGVLIERLGSPFALLLNAVTFLVAGLLTWRIRHHEPLPDPNRSTARAYREIFEGLKFSFGHPLLRPLALEAANYNFFQQVYAPQFLLYATRQLQISPGALGLVFAAGGAGALVGSLLATPAARRYGLGRVIVSAEALACVVTPLVLLPRGGAAGTIALLAGVYFLIGLGSTLSLVNSVSLRQAATPPALLGRMTASYRFLSYGIMPLGALLGGAVAGATDLEFALYVGTCGMAGAWLWLLASPLLQTALLPESHP